MAYTDNLDQYKTHPNTRSCYLDGRYFNKVFANYPGLIREPLNILISRNKRTGELRYDNYMKETYINNNYPGLLRVIINTPEGRHSNLIVIDYAGSNLYRFDPYGQTSPYFDHVNHVIEEYLDRFLDFEMYTIDNPIYDEKNPTCVSNGKPGGFCVAYVIKYAYDYLNGKNYDPSDILKFAGMIETKYGPLSEIGKDVEYGLFDGPDGSNNPNQGRNVAGGMILGGVAGAALTGSPVGFLGGLAAGGLIGSAI